MLALTFLETSAVVCTNCGWSLYRLCRGFKNRKRAVCFLFTYRIFCWGGVTDFQFFVSLLIYSFVLSSYL